MARGVPARRGRSRPPRGTDSAPSDTAPPVPAPFFSFERAALQDPLRITRVIAVTMPMSDLRNREALYEHVVKKLLHKPYIPSVEERQQSDAPTTSCDGAAPVAAAVDTKDDDAAAAATPYVVVHLDHLEVHSDTARQVNARGDVQLNVMLTLTVAKITRHGLLVGVAETSPFASCMQVRIPADSSVTPAPSPHGTKRRRTRPAATSTENPYAACMRITVRCLAEEPVVDGQAVLVVSEPGWCLRCLALRPPRPAPGPFHLVAGASGVEVVCDLPSTPQTGTRHRAGTATKTEA